MSKTCQMIPTGCLISKFPHTFTGKVRDHAILLNMGSLRAIVKLEHVLIFNYNRNGGKAFIESLLPHLNPRNTTGGPCMPFVLEVVEAALVSRIQQLEQRMMDLNLM